MFDTISVWKVEPVITAILDALTFWTGSPISLKANHCPISNDENGTSLGSISYLLIVFSSYFLVVDFARSRIAQQVLV